MDVRNMKEVRGAIRMERRDQDGRQPGILLTLHSKHTKTMVTMLDNARNVDALKLEIFFSFVRNALINTVSTFSLEFFIIFS